MSTNSTIAIKTDKGYEAIYCHNDGYFDYMYPMLDTWYNSWERAQALVSFGDASFIAKRIMPSKDSNHHFDHPEEDVCIFYHRDRGEPWEFNKPNFYQTKEEVLSTQYYCYIFENGCWTAYAGREEVPDYDYVEHENFK
jgi:hypothetical protein